MNWTELLRTEIDSTYRVTQALMDLVDDDRLDWKPASGSNWMTTGQLLCHLTDACGASMRGFVTGEWGMPEGMPAEDMLPPAERLPTVGSVQEAKSLLADDQKLALEVLARCSEERLANELVAAPWNPANPRALGYQLLSMVVHLAQHKGQLFYYLKLQGKPVHTGHLWGM
jgi:hypothetical protein